ncbi:MAG: hypothetical protein LBS27_11890 [Bifidobacteriaceae bacterium]|jgi:hypothetical protein|nr:hypothetical protein [Bifidobacteriaceae bacterium]
MDHPDMDRIRRELDDGSRALPEVAWRQESRSGHAIGRALRLVRGGYPRRALDALAAIPPGDTRNAACAQVSRELARGGYPNRALDALQLRE